MLFFIDTSKIQVRDVNRQHNAIGQTVSKSCLWAGFACVGPHGGGSAAGTQLNGAVHGGVGDIPSWTRRVTADVSDGSPGPWGAPC